MNNKDVNMISNLPEFISNLEQIVNGLDFKNFEVFFRGHSDKNYLLVPHLLRNGSKAKPKVGKAKPEIVNNEHIAFRSIVAKQSSEFSQCKSAIEYLVKMQHYGLKTRLLDITSNALIALYFACVNSSGEPTDRSGEVIVFKLPKNIIKHYDSDTISALANIAKCKSSDFYFPLCGDINNPGAFTLCLGNDERSKTNIRYTSRSFIPDIWAIRKEIQDLSGRVSDDNKKKYQDILYPILDILSTLFGPEEEDICECIKKCEDDEMKNKEKTRKNLTNLINSVDKKTKDGNCPIVNINKKIQEFNTDNSDTIPRKYIDWFNDNLGYLHHQIKAEKSYYTPQIEPYDLGKIWAVNTKLDNQRITNQSGAFLIFGLGVNEVKDKTGVMQLSYTKEIYPLIPDEWIAGRITIGTPSDTDNPQNGDIKVQKEKIVKDLGMLGIYPSFLFPDLDNVAKEINGSLLK